LSAGAFTSHLENSPVHNARFVEGVAGSWRVETKFAAVARNPTLHQLRLLWYIVNMSEEELRGIIQSNPEIMGGTPVFIGTRVPLQNLIDYLEGGESVEDFLEAFPAVKREQVIAVIEAGKLKMLETV